MTVFTGKWSLDAATTSLRFNSQTADQSLALIAQYGDLDWEEFTAIDAPRADTDLTSAEPTISSPGCKLDAAVDEDGTRAPEPQPEPELSTELSAEVERVLSVINSGKYPSEQPHQVLITLHKGHCVRCAVCAQTFKLFWNEQEKRLIDSSFTKHFHRCRPQDSALVTKSQVS